MINYYIYIEQCCFPVPWMKNNFHINDKEECLPMHQNIGQEATQIGSAYALKEDWIVPSFGDWVLAYPWSPLKNIFILVW